MSGEKKEQIFTEEPDGGARNFYKLEENPEYQENVERLLNADPVRAEGSFFEKLILKILNNIKAAYQKAESLAGTAGKPGGAALLNEEGKLPMEQLPNMENFAKVDQYNEFAEPQWFSGEGEISPSEPGGQVVVYQDYNPGIQFESQDQSGMLTMTGSHQSFVFRATDRDNGTLDYWPLEAGRTTDETPQGVVTNEYLWDKMDEWENNLIGYVDRQIIENPGPEGPPGPPGPTGPQGEDGAAGPAGKSAYTAAVEQGYTGTEKDFGQALAAMPGHQGNTEIHMTAAEKSKLSGVAANANNYTHPSSHAATMITQDSTHRFATDAEKTAWNGKANTLTYTATLSTSWSGSGPYTQTVTVTGLLSTDNPIIDAVFSGTTSTAKNQRDAWVLVDRIVTGANSITAYAYDKKPTTAIPIQIKVVR